MASKNWNWSRCTLDMTSVTYLLESPWSPTSKKSTAVAVDQMGSWEWVGRWIRWIFVRIRRQGCEHVRMIKKSQEGKIILCRLGSLEVWITFMKYLPYLLAGWQLLATKRSWRSMATNAKGEAFEISDPEPIQIKWFGFFPTQSWIFQQMIFFRSQIQLMAQRDLATRFDVAHSERRRPQRNSCASSLIGSDMRHTSHTSLKCWQCRNGTDGVTESKASRQVDKSKSSGKDIHMHPSRSEKLHLIKWPLRSWKASEQRILGWGNAGTQCIYVSLSICRVQSSSVIYDIWYTIYRYNLQHAGSWPKSPDPWLPQHFFSERCDQIQMEAEAQVEGGLWWDMRSWFLLIYTRSSDSICNHEAFQIFDL